MPSIITKQQANKALDGMREIVRHEMLIQGDYVENEISNPRLKKSGSICGGRKHCAIGSLWVGGGIKAEISPGGYSLYLPGASAWARDDFLRSRHGLRLAYIALNEAAAKFAKDHKIKLDNMHDGALEDLFEGYYGDKLTKRDMLQIIRNARRMVNKA